MKASEIQVGKTYVREGKERKVIGIGEYPVQQYIPRNDNVRYSVKVHGGWFNGNCTLAAFAKWARREVK